MVPRPSSSVLLLSPTNQVLLLHRVRTSTSFASAHVFPGGNLSTYHEGPLIPPPDSPLRHVDGPAYRLAAIRETFEESGILLALDSSGRLLEVDDATREEGRKNVHAGDVKFADWVRGLGGEPDVDGLLPFTRWVTPTNIPKRFSTQMYLYMLPLEAKGDVRREVVVPTPTHDGGLEHTAATFDSIADWLEAARQGRIILFPPQYYLLFILSQFIKPGEGDFKAQRETVRRFLSKTPTGREGDPTAMIPWAEKVMSPTAMFMLPGDGRLVMGIDKPGPELRDSGRGGDKDRVVLVEFAKEGPKRVEVRSREKVLKLRREAEVKEEKGKL
jgi:8-oxo-dGTP pyrophosphatase MutT (NUDIX family)